MSNPPPIVDATITCRDCGHTETRRFRAWVGARVTLWCNGCGTKMTLILEP